MSQATHFDAIIIGTGAGGGTLAYHLAPSGKRILLLERGDYLPRERDNWNSTAVFIDAKYRAKETWTRQGRQDLSSRHPVLRRRRHQGLRRRPAAPAQGGLRGNPTPRRHFPRLAVELRGLRALLHQGGAPLPRAWGARDRSRPNRSPAHRIVIRPSATSRAFSNCTTTWFAWAITPFRCRSASCSTRKTARRRTTSRCIRCDRFDGFPCLVHGKADAEVLCVTPALEHANVQLLTNAYVERLETSAFRPGGDQGPRPAQRRARGILGRHRGRRVRRHQLGRPAAALGQRPAPAGAGQQLGRRRPLLHAP